MIKKIINHLALAHLVLILISCSNREQQDLSGFLSESENFSPITNSYFGPRPAIRIKPSVNDKIIIYLHGTISPRITPNCYIHKIRIPRVILELQNKNTHIYFLCSSATNLRSDLMDGGNYIYRRVEELKVVLLELQEAGMDPENIYLPGYSAGAWTSLIANSVIEDHLFNGIIGLAPAFAGKRDTRSKSGRRSQLRNEQILMIQKSTKLNALIFAYDHDEYENTSDLSFLTSNPEWNLTFVNYDCEEGHRTPHSDCKFEETLEFMKEYIGIPFDADTTYGQKL